MLAKLIANTIVNFTLESCYFVEVKVTDFINQDKNKTENSSMGFRSYNPLDMSSNPPKCVSSILLGVFCSLPDVSHRYSQAGWARLTLRLL